MTGSLEKLWTELIGWVGEDSEADAEGGVNTDIGG